MELGSILNKTSAISKPSPSSVVSHDLSSVNDPVLSRFSQFVLQQQQHHHTHSVSSATSSLTPTFTPSSTLSTFASSAPLMSSHFTIEHSVLRRDVEAAEEESKIVEEKPVPVREFGSRAPDEYNHSHHKLMAMADLVTDPAYTQQSAWTYQYNDSAGRPYWQHPLLTPVTSTSPQEYARHNDCFPTVSAADAVTRANGSVCDEDGTDIDNTSAANDRDAVSYATPPTVGGGMNEAAGNTIKAASGNGKKSEALKNIHFCQYTDPDNGIWGPCNENPNPEDINARKIVSHIFGRNKKPTQNIPDHLWIWYCRKHYQRSKYTCSNQWPQKQVDLVRQALNNFEQWGKIAYWNIVLRKREQDRQARTRCSAGSMGSPTSDVFYFAASPRRRTAGKIPRSQKARVTAAATAGHPLESMNFDALASRNAHPGLTPTGRRKASPKNVPCPVPDFVERYLGENRSFIQVRALIDEIENYIQGKDKTPEQLAREADEEEMFGRAPEVRRFPDIEILPVFSPGYQRSVDRKDENEKRQKKSNIRAGDVGLSQSSSKTAKIYKSGANSDIYRDASRGYQYQAAAPGSSNHIQQYQQQHQSFQLPPPPQLAPVNPGFHLPPPVPQHTTHAQSTLPYSSPYREFSSYNPSQQHDGRTANAQPHTPFHHQQHEGRGIGLPLPSFHSQFPLPDF